MKAHRSDCIFKNYVRMLVKLKVEASGFPAEVVTEEQRIDFAEEYNIQYGIDIVPEHVHKNPGLRFISKIMLNSLWYRSHKHMFYFERLGANFPCAITYRPTKWSLNLPIFFELFWIIEWYGKKNFVLNI